MRVIITAALIFTFSSFQSCANNPENTTKESSEPIAETQLSNPTSDQGWKTQDDSLYSIEYPDNWEINYTGKQGISFIAVSPKDSEADHFRENLTLVVDYRKGKDTDLKALVDENTEQVRGMITGSKLVEDTERGSGIERYHEVKYKVEKGSTTLLYTQRFFLHNGTAFVLSFTCDQAKIDQFAPTRSKIFDSFRLK